MLRSALAAVAAVLALTGAKAPAYDLVIRDARVVDGSGRPAFRADVAVRGDTIVAVSRQPLRGAAEVIDARGRVLAPGFIDSHAHGDPLDSAMENFVSQGVTLVVLGQDGRTPGASDEDGETGTMTYAQWRAAVDGTPLTLNVASLVGLGSLREQNGVGAATTVTPAQQAAMRASLDDSLSRGAFGLSSGLEYVPDRYATKEELVDLAKVVGRRNGVIMSHMRTENDGEIAGAIDELMDQGRHARVHVAHIKVVSGHGRAAGEAVVRQIEAANTAGVKLSADVYPYTAGFADFGLVYPAWAKQEAEFNEAVRTRRPELEEAIRVKVIGRNGPGAILISSGPDVGLTVEEAAKKAGKPFQVYIIDAGYGGPAAAHFVMDDALQQVFLESPRIALSTDGAPGMRHPRSWGSYSRVIEEFVVERKALTLEAAVRKATGFPARDILGLKDRGFVAAGMKADLVLFDPVRVRTTATWTAPAQAAEGFDLVLVNGQAVWRDGKLTAARPGRLLKGGRR